MSVRKTNRSMRFGNLNVEHLESRLVPTTTPLDWENVVPLENEVTPTDPTEIYTTSILSPEVPVATFAPPLRVKRERLEQLAENLVESNEFLGNQVDIAFQRILGRSSGMGKSHWVASLQNGNIEPEDLSSRFIASDEFLANMDYNAKNMVRFIFFNYLDRAPSEMGLGHWVSRLDSLSRDYLQKFGQGESWFDVLTPPSNPDYATAKDPFFVGLAPSNRTPQQSAALKHSLEKVAWEIQHSEESRTGSIAALYKGILHRDGSPAEIAGWKKSSLGETGLIQRFISSPEFQKRFQNIQELVAGAYSEVLFRPAGVEGVKAWTNRLGGSADDHSWVNQVPGVEGYQGSLDDKMLQQVLQLVYANGITSITIDDRDYPNRFDPNLIARVGGAQVRMALPPEERDSVPTGDRKAFWEQVGKGAWDSQNGKWTFSYEASPGGGQTGQIYDFSIDFNTESDSTDLMAYIKNYQLGSWSGIIQNIDGKLPSGLDLSQVIWSLNIGQGAGDDSWQCVVPVDPISPLRPIDGVMSTYADLNGDGIVDQITTLRGDFFPGAESLVQVFFGQNLEPTDSNSQEQGSGGTEGNPIGSGSGDWSFPFPGGFGAVTFTGEPSYSIVPYQGYSGRLTVAAGDFDGDGNVELAVAPRDYFETTPVDGAFPEPLGKPQVSLFHGLDGSFINSVPLPADMVWKVWQTETDPVTNVTTDLLADGVDGLVVGAGDLTSAGFDHLILATGGQNAQIWIGNQTAGDNGAEWSWRNGPLAKNQNAHGLTVADINFDGQLDIGLNATELADGPISTALYIPPKTLWFDGKSFEPISLPDPGEDVLGTDGNFDRTWLLGVFENMRAVVLSGGDNRALLESYLESFIPVFATVGSSAPNLLFGGISGLFDGLLGWLGRPEFVDSLLNDPEVISFLEELRTILSSDDYKDQLAKYLDDQFSGGNPVS